VRLRNGVCEELEAVADELLRLHLKETPARDHDIMTPWKIVDRRRKEVYVASGVPDASVRLGCYHRAANTGRPELNSRDGIARARSATGWSGDRVGGPAEGSDAEWYDT
jgi:hypothetical protein